MAIPEGEGKGGEAVTIGRPGVERTRSRWKVQESYDLEHRFKGLSRCLVVRMQDVCLVRVEMQKKARK